ncbi:fimbrial protein [Pseudomonas chlororaphis]|uniref:fimbrial protein n=1 Tax=Pseudomonas chlororaphis TaxID=587753 RepID=UPI0006A58DF2|nr:fimbrial protein [Pseudomonas chlororaphis]AZD02891.1 hypothetical protein C4K27_3699 [Pseudomonas chlororaphis subsp. chlororaphis]MBM0286168.1 type 1 fimbrial protein [Pseudomonas chlororaphis]MDO1504445.1 type 1 fimbrial protein [Pseudomonas chlororaphis]ORM44793.1 fimbrial protein [Pseudomonas chlororaphis subsp. chlororaphis]TWR95588.1 type 1 fimbrial protein [Pseudomonas chlororaphis subsp. chlororaphis]
MFRSRGFNPLLVLLIVAGSFFSPYSVAAIKDVCVPLFSAVVDVPFSTSLVVQKDAPVGSVLASAEVRAPMRCTNSYYPTGRYAKYFKSSSNAAIGTSNGVFKTSLSGVGLRWSISGPSGNYSFSSTALNSKEPAIGFSFPYLGGDKYYTLEHKFDLIKLGDVSAGSFQFSQVSMMTAPDSMLGGLYDQQLNTFTFPMINIKASSCFLAQDNVKVNMGRVNASDFRGQGSVMPSRDFSIDVLCNGSSALVLALDSSNQAAGYSGTVKLSSSGQSAQGIGIQVLNASTGDYTPMALGQPQLMSWASSGVNSIKLAARYIQTGSSVSGGKADGTLTFVLNYL